MLKGLPLSRWRVLSRHMRYLIAPGVMILSSYLPSPAVSGTESEELPERYRDRGCYSLQEHASWVGTDEIENLYEIFNRAYGESYTLVDFFLKAKCRAPRSIDPDLWIPPIHVIVEGARESSVNTERAPAGLRDLKKRMIELSGSENAFFAAINRVDSQGTTAIDLIDKTLVPTENRPDYWIGLDEWYWIGGRPYNVANLLRLREALCDWGVKWSAQKPSCTSDLPILATSWEAVFLAACDLVRSGRLGAFEDMERLFSGNLAKMRRFFLKHNCLATYRELHTGDRVVYTTTPMNHLISHSSERDVVLAFLTNDRLFDNRQREKVLLRKDALGFDVRDRLDLMLEAEIRFRIEGTYEIGALQKMQEYSLELCLLGARCE